MKRKPALSPTWQLMMLATVVVPVLVVGYPLFTKKRLSPIQATMALVATMRTGIAAYQTTTWSWQTDSADGPVTHREPLWDLNHDGLLDGRPSVGGGPGSDGGFPPEVIASGYRGAVEMLRPELKRFDLNASGQVVDSWGHPLRIAYAAQAYGTLGFGIWSLGPDGVEHTRDDITSWEPAAAPP